MIAFSVPGMPKGKGRGTPVKRGAHLAIAVEPATQAYQNKVAMAAAAAMNGAALMEGGLKVWVLIRFPVPISYTRRKREEIASGARKPTRKPDASNVLKALEDGCNGVVWRDDAQVTTVAVRKVYADLPGLDVQIGPDTFVP